MRTTFHAYLTILLLGLTGPVLADQSASAKEIQSSMEQMAAAQSKMMQAMMLEKPSKLGFDETVSTLLNNAKSRGWTVAGVMDMQEAMRKAGDANAKPMKIIGMCPQKQVEAVLHAEQAEKMPPGGVSCRYNVYVGKDGKTYVMRFNTELVAQMSPAPVAAALGNFAREEDAVLSGVVR